MSTTHFAGQKQKRPFTRKNEGEADNPGPMHGGEYIRIAGANVTSLRKRWPIAKGWPYHALCVQETMLGEQAQKDMEGILATDGWIANRGQPQPLKQKIRAGNDDGRNVNDARHGGVAVICSSELILETVPRDQEYDYLFDDGRLQHSFMPVGSGKVGIHLISLYGHASAESPEERRRLNRELYEGTLSYAQGFGRVPMLIFGDFNPNPAEEDLVEEAIAGTEWTDVHAAWAEGPENAANTFFREGPYEGVVGKGATRPDRVLANREGLAAVKNAWVDYNADNWPHALPVVELDVTCFQAEYCTLVRPKRWDIKQLKEKKGRRE